MGGARKLKIARWRTQTWLRIYQARVLYGFNPEELVRWVQLGVLTQYHEGRSPAALARVSHDTLVLHAELPRTDAELRERRQAARVVASALPPNLGRDELYMLARSTGR